MKTAVQINFTTLPELLGTFAFAVSGMREAAGKQIDWYGTYIPGLVTSFGEVNCFHLWIEDYV